MKKIKNMTIGELAAYICSFLSKNNIQCVLSGGACVSIYTKNNYISYDIDFIDNSGIPAKKIKTLLESIGFKEKNRYFIHKESKFIIEFPKGPVSVGSEPIKKFNQIKFTTGVLFLLLPADCVKDRLAAFYHWNDIQALQQAILVARKNKVNIKEIQRWSEAENMPDKFKIFKQELRKL